MIEQALRRIGLTEGEAKVYMALLELGSCTTGKITKSAGVSGSKVYEVLDRLTGKGLASFSVKNGVKHFEPTPPERILDYLDERKREIEQEKAGIEKILPALILKQQRMPSSEAKVYTGWRGIKTVTEDIIATLGRGDVWRDMGLSEQPKHIELWFNRKQEERAKKGIVHKFLLNEKYMSLYEARKHIANTQTRFLSASFEMPTATQIYGNKVAILIMEKQTPFSIIIESEAVANSFLKYFEAMWSMAKSP